MKRLFPIMALMVSFSLQAQDSIAKVEPEHTTSFENYKLLIIAVVGLLLLIGIRLWFKRNRKN